HLPTPCRSAALLLLVACAPHLPAEVSTPPRGAAPAVDPTAPALRRLTQPHYVHTLSALLGDGMVLPSSLESDTATDGLVALGAAEAGELVTDAGLAAEVERMIADPSAHEGVRAFFTEMLELADLNALNRDPALFTHMSPEVGPSAREETLLGIEAIVFADED